MLEGSNAASLGLDASRLAVVGDSAGGNLAAVVAAEFHDQIKVSVPVYPGSILHGVVTASKLENADAPVLSISLGNWFHRMYFGDRTDLHSHPLASPINRGPPVPPVPPQRRVGAPTRAFVDVDGEEDMIHATAEALQQDAEHPQHDAGDATAVDASAAAAAAIPVYPRTHVITAELDILRDEGEYYAEFLRSAGVQDVSLTRYNGTVHGFFGISIFPHGRAALQDVCSYVRTHL